MSQESTAASRIVRNGLIVSLLVLLLACTETAPNPRLESAPTIVAGAVATPTVADTPTPMPPSEPSTPATPSVPATPGLDSKFPPTNFELSKYALHAGEVVSLNGEGFSPGEIVQVLLNGNPVTVLGELNAGTQGQIQAHSLNLPALTEGMHTITLTGVTSGRRVERQFSIIGFHPWVVLDSYAIHAGESFGFSGTDFAPGESVTVFLDSQNNQAVGEFKADNEGGLRGEELIRATPKQVGKHTLQFISGQTGVSLPVGFEVLAFVPTYELSSYAGLPGSTVSFSGRGFAPGETVRASFQLGNEQRELSSFSADENGAFANAGQSAIPPDAQAGRLTLRLEGEDSRVPVTQSFGVLPLAPWGGLTSYSGPPGTRLDFLGNGFAAGETVAVYLGAVQGSEPIQIADADGQGEIRTTFAIPADAASVLTFTFIGQSSQGQATAEFTVTGN